jgi:hypothetical protein
MPGAVGDKGDEGAVGPQGQQGERGLQGVPGADALWNYVGNWQPNTSYALGDIVTMNGSCWYANKNTTVGNVPGETNDFDLIASKGADGTNGTNGTNGTDALWNFLGEYNGAADYNIGDVVTYNGGTYYRILPLNAGYAPGTEYWTTIAAPGEDALNIGVPYSGVQENTNTAVGEDALQNNTLGLNNTAIGHGAMADNTIAVNNVAIGMMALNKNIGHMGNTAVGSHALFSSVTGYLNTAIGLDAMLYKTTGYSNTAVGSEALENNTTGSFNTAIGVDAGINNVTGSGNIFVGFNAGGNELGSNKLYIDNSNTSTPLIHGDFDTNTMTVNGSLKVSTGATGTFHTPDAKIVVVTNGIITSIESLT